MLDDKGRTRIEFTGEGGQTIVHFPAALPDAAATAIRLDGGEG